MTNDPLIAWNAALAVPANDNMTALSNADREVIVHALGLNRRGACVNHRRWSSRNSYYGRSDDPQLVSLVERGLMIAGRIPAFNVMPNGQYFHVTSAGARAVGMENRVRREDRLKHERRSDGLQHGTCWRRLPWLAM